MEPTQNTNDDTHDRTVAQHDPFDDPNVTAYALGELEIPEDLARVEALIDSDPRYREAVDAIRQTASVLTAELGAEGGPTLSADQRATMAEQIQKRSTETGEGPALKYDGKPVDMNPALWRRRSFWACAGMTGIAACATFVAMWPSLFEPAGGGRSELALRVESDATEARDCAQRAVAA
ncbi:MAG: hypothetical protein HND57_14920 [Planctomycetes bacterium]|nr:hypothetical protein [Planctomycetota bacterium]